MSTLLNSVINFVDDSFGKKKPHFERTLYWLLQLKPDADEAMQIAAYSHDIERAFRKDKENKLDDLNDGKQLENHQKEGAQIMTEFLTSQNAFQELIEEVAHLISKHEVGGDDTQNLLKDADCISYFEVNAQRHVRDHVATVGKDKVQEKLELTFNKITSLQAKELAKPLFERALQLLHT